MALTKVKSEQLDAAQTSITSVGTLTGLTVSGDLTVDTSTLVVDATNNRVGIGTSSPDSLFHVAGAANIRIAYNGTSANYMDADTNIFRSGNGAERMRIDSTGSLGLGVTNMGSNGLSILNSMNFNISEGANSSFVNIFRQASSAATVIANGYKYASGANAFASSYSSSWAKSAIALNYGTIRFYTDSATTTASGTTVTPTEAMRIDSSGNVGIGTITPGNKFTLYDDGGYWATIQRGNSTPGGNAPWLGLFDNINIANATYGWGIYDSNADGSFQIWNKNNSTTGYNTFTIKRGGNVGIGTSNPSTKGHFYSGTSMDQLSVDGAGAIETGINFKSSGTTYGQIYFNNVSPYDMSVLQQYSTGSLIFGTNDTERMRIDSSGELTLGNPSGGSALQLDVSATGSDGVDIKGTYYTGSYGPIKFHTGGTERMRILANGTTSLFSGTSNTLELNTSSNSAGTNNLIRGFSGSNINGGGTVRFVVFPSGNVQNSNNSYGAISDQKLKENIADAGSQWDDIKAIRVRKYSLIADSETTANRLGVIAQELEASGMSGLVEEYTDLGLNNEDLGTTTKGVKYSVLYMKAIKALQEAMTKIEDLEARITQLENN